jgi:hypothetical protein
MHALNVDMDALMERLSATRPRSRSLLVECAAAARSTIVNEDAILQAAQARVTTLPPYPRRAQTLRLCLTTRTVYHPPTFY